MTQPQPEFDVFLSYKSEDEAWVRGLKAALCARGLQVWLDRDEILPGDRLVQAVTAIAGVPGDTPEYRMAPGKADHVV